MTLTHLRCVYQNVLASILKILSDRSQTLTIFLGSILVKKYTNPSSDIITVLAGLDEVDQVFTDFVAVLDKIIRSGGQRKLLYSISRINSSLSEDNSGPPSKSYQNDHRHDQRSIQNKPRRLLHATGFLPFHNESLLFLPHY